MSENSPGTNDTTCKIIAAFVALTSHLIMHQIDVTSAHFSIAFNIPVNNISIYFSKLFSLRCFLIAAGTSLELVVSQIARVFDPGGKTAKTVRKWFSIVCFAIVLVIRLIFLGVLHLKSNLGYLIYIVLTTEAFFFGYFHASVIAMAAEHSLAVALAANVSRFFILFAQLIIDLLFYNQTLLMIKVQVWIIVVMTIAGVLSWIFYHEYESCDSASLAGAMSPEVDEKPFLETLVRVVSPFLMFFGGSMFKDFLFPGILPYALLTRDKCHGINMMVPVSNMVGPLVLFILESLKLFETWKEYFNVFWLLSVPMAVIFAFSFLAIHSRIPYARATINSKRRVMLLTLGVVFGNGFLDPLSFGGVAKVVKKGFQNKDNNGKKVEGNNSIFSAHVLSALFMRFVFAKLSVGYNDTRVSLGYCLPKFRPKHKMSKSNLGWYIFRQTFKRAWKDTGSDFKMDVKKYL